MRWAKSVLPICLVGFSLFAGCGDDDNSSAADGAAAGEAGAAGAGGGDSTVGGSDTSTLGGSETSGGSGSMSEAGAATAGAAGAGDGGEDSCVTGGAQYDCETCQTVNQQPGGCCFDVVESCGDECNSMFDLCSCVGAEQPIAACVEACASDNDVSDAGASQFLAVMICTLGQQSTLAPGACGRACLDLPAPGCKDGGQEHADCDECTAIENAANGCCALEATDCAPETECGELVNCKGQCTPGDFDCTAQCEAAHPDGIEVERAYRVCSTGTTTDSGACGDVCRPVECSQGGADYASCGDCQNALVDSCCWAEFEACRAETGVCTSDNAGWEALGLCFVGDSNANPGACRIACEL